MPRTIINKNIAAANVKCLSMTADQIGRTMQIGNQWNTLHIGVLVGFQGVGATVTSPTMAIGVCSGTTQMFGSFAGFTRNFFGIRTVGNVTFNGGSPSSYQPSIAGVRKVGTTVTDTGSAVALLGDATANLLTFVGVRLVKSGGNIAISVFGCTNTLSTQNKPFTDWLMQLEYRTFTASANFGNYTLTSLGSLAYDEATNGTLDTINLSYNQATIPVVIKDFGASIRR
jgi:hypothetical protein